MYQPVRPANCVPPKPPRGIEDGVGLGTEAARQRHRLHGRACQRCGAKHIGAIGCARRNFDLVEAAGAEREIAVDVTRADGIAGRTAYHRSVIAVVPTVPVPPSVPPLLTVTPLARRNRSLFTASVGRR